MSSYSGEASSVRFSYIKFDNGMYLTIDSNNNFALFTSTGTQIAKVPNLVGAGTGFPIIYGNTSTVGNSSLVTNAINFTPPATAGTYRISAYVNVRTSAAVDMNITIAYKDGAGVARSEVLALMRQNTTTIVNNMNATLGRFTGSYIFQIDNSATAITLSSTGITMTLYDLAATLEQLA